MSLAGGAGVQLILPLLPLCILWPGKLDMCADVRILLPPWLPAVGETRDGEGGEEEEEVGDREEEVEEEGEEEEEEDDE